MNGTVPPVRLCAASVLVALATAACVAPRTTFHAAAMDFGMIQSVAVLPLVNHSRGDQAAAGRVRDVLVTMLLATEAFYVLPQGEVARAVSRLGLQDAAAPSTEDVIKLGRMLKVDVVFTGAVREYGEVRSGQSSANVVSLSLQAHEVQTGKVVWSGSATRGGVGVAERLLGGGGAPMNVVTEDAIRALLRSLFSVPKQRKGK